MSYITSAISTAAYNILPVIPTATSVVRGFGSICCLSESDEAEVLAFLNQRPVHTVVMTSFIIDNGIESELNRGDFYGYRNLDGELEAVALLGHTTLIEARNEFALEAIADAAREIEKRIHIIMSSGDTANKFWSYYSDGFEQPRLSCTELLFEVQYPYLVAETRYELRRARAQELMDVASAHAEIALLESGVDPMVTDREGFLARVMRRIEQGRVFVVYENDELVFKADIVAETADVIYLEGVYVAPGRRGEGIGPACLAQLTCELLKKVQNVCLLSNISFIDAHMSYLKAGYRNTDSCVTLFV